MHLQYTVLLLFVTKCVSNHVSTDCGKKEMAVSELEFAIDIINRAKSNVDSYLDIKRNVSKIIDDIPLDCADILRKGHRNSGVYKLRINNRVTGEKLLNVYCDMDTDGGGWTVIQRRGNYGNPHDYFFREWSSYKEGFGNIEEDFWLGNDNIFALTNQKLYSARFDLEDVEGTKKYAQYDYFWIEDEFNNYTLHVAEYTGNAGDSLSGHHNNAQFSTKDVENDIQPVQNCAQLYKGGWWYKGCHDSNLNGLYLRGPHESFADGINWLTWKGYHESMERTEIKIRPNKFHALAKVAPQ